MRLGLALGYWASAPPVGVDRLVARAEALGFDSLWTSEAYGSDALTPLAWWGSRTERLRLGTAVAQISARAPAATAMAAATVDHLSGGRFVLGLGVSGPQVVEGWYGQPFPRPLERTREYVAIVRAVLARESPVAFAGRQYRLPSPGGSGLGRALRLTVHPRRPDLPILLAAEGPRNISLAAEIADGWLPLFYAPGRDRWQREALAEGFRRTGARRPPHEFEIVGAVPLAEGPDVETAADTVRPQLALYIGGMGARDANFHRDVFLRLGFVAEARRVQDLYLAGRRVEAAQAIPAAMVEAVALVGPRAKLREEAGRWRDSLLTTVVVSGGPETLELAAELFG